jgi:hypothetical protein
VRAEWHPRAVCSDILHWTSAHAGWLAQDMEDHKKLLADQEEAAKHKKLNAKANAKNAKPE